MDYLATLPNILSFEKRYSHKNVIDYQLIHTRYWNKRRLSKKENKFHEKLMEWNNQEVAKNTGFSCYKDYAFSKGKEI